jgi:hypothetical protein
MSLDVCARCAGLSALEFAGRSVRKGTSGRLNELLQLVDAV